jgi:hypothetical protein
MKSCLLGSEQRQYFADIVHNAKNEAERQFTLKRYSCKVEATRDLAKKHGVLDIAERTAQIHNQLDQLERELNHSGFEIDARGSISLWAGAPRELRRELEALTKKRIGATPDVKRFDLALLAVYAAESAADAKAIVEPFL